MKENGLGRDESKHISCGFEDHEEDCPQDCSQCAISMKLEGDAALKDGDVVTALRKFKKAVFMNPKYAEAWCGLANAYVLQSENNNAINAFNKAIAIDPKYGDALFGKAVALRNIGKNDDAMALTNAILELYDSNQVSNLKKELKKEGVKDTFGTYPLTKAIDLMTDRCDDFIRENNLLDARGLVTIEDDLYQKVDFAKGICDFCSRRYHALGQEKVWSESILAAYYGAICFTILYYKNPAEFKNTRAFSYISEHINLEELERNAEKLLEITDDSEEMERVWNIAYSFVQYCIKIIPGVTPVTDTDAAVRDAAESAFVMGVLYAMRHKEAIARTSNQSAVDKELGKATVYGNDSKPVLSDEIEEKEKKTKEAQRTRDELARKQKEAERKQKETVEQGLKEEQERKQIEAIDNKERGEHKRPEENAHVIQGDQTKKIQKNEIGKNNRSNRLISNAWNEWGINPKLKIALIVLGILVIILPIYYFATYRNTKDIKFENNKISIRVDESTPLVSFIEPDNAKNVVVEYKSSDSGIAYVEDNILTGNTPGEVTIGVYQDGKLFDECVVSVYEVKPTSISLTIPDVVYCGDYYLCPVKFIPDTTTDKDVLIESSDQSILATDNNITRVRVLAEGTATLKVTHSTTGLSDEITVTVKPVEPTVVLIDNAPELMLGKSEKCAATFEPENTTYTDLEWTSSDNSVISITDGVMTGKKMGTATITAKHGSGIVGTKDIEVIPVPCDSVRIKGNTDEITVGNTLKLTADISPEDTTYKSVEWSSSNTDVATIGSDGIVYTKKPGNTLIRCETKDGKSATYSIKVTPIPVNQNNGFVIAPAATSYCTFTINAPISQDCYVVMKPASYLSTIGNHNGTKFSVFVNAGTSCTVNVPTGSYDLYYATGEQWYGKDYIFGEDTHYYKASRGKNYVYKPVAFTQKNTSDGIEYTVYEVTLYLVENGNMGREEIDKSEFMKD